MKLKGREINPGQVSGQALVLDAPFSFIGEFDPQTGQLVLEGHPLNGQSLAGKVLVCPSGKGGTIAPFIAYQAKQNGTAPIAIVCEQVDPMLCECALVLDIPMADSFAQSPVQILETGQTVHVSGGELTIEE